MSENRSPSHPTRADDTGRVDLAAAESEIPLELAVFPSESTMPKRWRFALRPVVLMLLVGGTLGIAGGYAVGMRERQPSPIATTDTDAPPTPAAPATVPVPSVPAPPADRVGGQLDVQSSPSGARVFIDDFDVGKTPAALRDIVVGPHRIRIAMDGYTTEERQVVFSSAQPVPLLTVTLTPLTPPVAAAPAAQAPPPQAPPSQTPPSQTPPPQTPTSTPNPNAKPSPAPPAAAQPLPEEPPGPGLTVQSTPAGARVFVDNRWIGITPLRVPDAASGNHTVRLELRGYRPWFRDITIVDNQPSLVRGSLERQTRRAKR